MEDIYSFKRKRDQYYDLRDKLQIVVNNINNALETLRISRQKMGEAYSINNAEVGNERLSKYIQEFEEQRDNILYTVIPNIDRELYSLKWQIQKKESELADI